MTRITLDAPLRERLHGITEPVALCDETGRVIGRFIPAVEAHQYTPSEPQVNEDELRRREQSSQWYTTAEVLRNLEKR